MMFDSMPQFEFLISIIVGLYIMLTDLHSSSCRPFILLLKTGET